MEEEHYYTVTLCTSWNNLCPSESVLKIKVTYPISVFTEDVLQLKVSMSNACRRAHYQHDGKKKKNYPAVLFGSCFTCPPTLCVKEVESLGDVPDNLTGLQLIKVLSVLDVCKDGT